MTIDVTSCFVCQALLKCSKDQVQGKAEGLIRNVVRGLLKENFTNGLSQVGYRGLLSIMVEAEAKGWAGERDGFDERSKKIEDIHNEFVLEFQNMNSIRS